RPGWVSAALLLYVGFALASAPASVLAWVLTAVTGRATTMEGPQGSLWRGKAAALSTIDSSGAVLRYEGLSWRWTGARPALEIRISDRTFHATCLAVMSSWPLRLEALEARLPASALGTYIPALARYGLSGEVFLASKEIVFETGGFKGTALI